MIFSGSQDNSSNSFKTSELITDCRFKSFPLNPERKRSFRTESFQWGCTTRTPTTFLMPINARRQFRPEQFHNHGSFTVTAFRSVHMYGYTEQEPRLKISTAERYLTNPYKIRFCELAQDIMSKVPPRNADTPGSSGPDFQYRPPGSPETLPQYPGPGSGYLQTFRESLHDRFRLSCTMNDPWDYMIPRAFFSYCQK